LYRVYIMVDGGTGHLSLDVDSADQARQKAEDMALVNEVVSVEEFELGEIDHPRIDN